MKNITVMKQNLHFIPALLFLLPLFAEAQKTKSVNTETITLLSDSSTTSVVFNSTIPEKNTVHPTVIGIGTRNEMQQNNEYRSVLKFNYNKLPLHLFNSPLFVQKAELVLHTIDTAANRNAGFLVKRIFNEWQPLNLSWINQPDGHQYSQVAVQPATQVQDSVIRIDVTVLVQQMLFWGNNGFKFQSLDSSGITENECWFAAERYENAASRPKLIIKYLVAPTRQDGFSPAYINTAKDETEKYFNEIIKKSTYQNTGNGQKPAPVKKEDVINN